MALTDRQIKAMQPEDKPRRYHDAGSVPGLYIEVSPSGGKWWRFRFSLNGKQRLMSLGVYPEVSLKEARLAALEARQLVAAGRDPVRERAGARSRSAVACHSVREVAGEWLAGQEGRWTAAHAAKVRSRLERLVFPAIGEREVGEVGPRDVLLLCRQVESGISPYMGHVMLGLLSRLFRYAVASGRLASDPCRDIAGALGAHVARHMPALTDPGKVGELARKIDAYEGLLTTRAALQLLLLCMCRTQELRGMRWEEIDREAALWRIPAERMKMRQEHLVPLSRQAMRILDELRGVTGDGSLVFPSYCRQRRDETPLGKNTINNALRSMGYAKEVLVGHGFRSIASTLLNEQGWNPDVIESQLAHAPLNSVRAAYNRAAYLDDRRRMLQAWADYLDRLKAHAGPA